MNCTLCGDGRKNIRWFVNDKPVCKRHYDHIDRISKLFNFEVNLVTKEAAPKKKAAVKKEEKVNGKRKEERTTKNI